MGSKTKVPAPTAEEKALQASQAELLNLQTNILKQQQQQQAILLPFLAEQEGFQVETDEFGNITKISKTATENETKAKQLESEMLDRSLAALRGELPVSPGLERDIAKQGETLRDRLASQLGPGFETSSPGIEALAGFEESANIAREGARTAQLTLAEQLGITRQQQNQFTRQSSQDVLRQSSLGDPLTLAGAFGQVATGFGQAQQPFIAQRQMQAQASASNASNFANIIGAGIGAAGKIGAAYFSDERLKDNAIRIGTHHKWGVPIYTFEIGGVRKIGIFAQDIAERLPAVIGERLGYRTVKYEAL